MPHTKAVAQFNARPRPQIGFCGCMGKMALPDEPECNGHNWDDIKRYPACPCSMQWVEEVDGSFYRIIVDKNGDAFDATFLGPVGGPYVE